MAQGWNICWSCDRRSDIHRTSNGLEEPLAMRRHIQVHLKNFFICGNNSMNRFELIPNDEFFYSILINWEAIWRKKSLKFQLGGGEKSKTDKRQKGTKSVFPDEKRICCTRSNSAVLFFVCRRNSFVKRWNFWRPPCLVFSIATAGPKIQAYVHIKLTLYLIPFRPSNWKICFHARRFSDSKDFVEYRNRNLMGTARRDMDQREVVHPGTGAQRWDSSLADSRCSAAASSCVLQGIDPRRHNRQLTAGHSDK